MTVQTPIASALVLDNVSWRDFKRWLSLLDGRPGLRVSYDWGTLEMTTLTFGHESIGRLLDRFVSALTEELGMPIAGGGSTTLWGQRQRKGLEPDQCYWIAHESAVRGKKHGQQEENTVVRQFRDWIRQHFARGK
jgi:Uma2 family endonuclease